MSDSKQSSDSSPQRDDDDSSEVKLIREDFEALDIESAIEQSKKSECFYFSLVFSERAGEAEKKGDRKGQAAWRYLDALCSLNFCPNDAHEPFRPLMIHGNGGRSFIPDDLSSENRTLTKELVSIVRDSELKARIADVCWLLTRDAECARTAIGAYLTSAARLEDPKHWSPFVERIERALRISASLGAQNPTHDTVLQCADKTIRKYNGEDPLFLTAKLINLMLEFGADDLAQYADIAEKVAQDASTKEN